jgi:butyrate kinase
VKGKDGNALDPKRVGLGNKDVRRSFSNEFRAYLESRQKWFENLKDFRDSLAHRIPLYIPPFIVTPETVDEYNKLEQASGEAMLRADINEYDRLQAEQKRLGKFRPWMTHSQFEKAPSVVFHSQLVADYVTVDEFGRTMLEELDR